MERVAFNPWAETGGILFLMMALLALLTFWVYKRVNHCRLYLYLSLFLGLDGLLILLFFRGNPLPALWQVILLGIMGLGILVLCNTIFLTILAVRLPMAGLEETNFINRDYGRINKFFLLIGSTVFFIVMRLLFKNSFLFIKSVLPQTSMWVIYIALIPLLALLSEMILPWVPEEEESALLGEQRPRLILENLFSVTGEVMRGEAIVIPLTGAMFYLVLMFVGKKFYTALDWLGILVFIIITALIIRGEWAKDQQITEEIARKLVEEERGKLGQK